MKKKHMWVIMKAHKWSSLSVMGVPLLNEPLDKCVAFMPIFSTKAAAVAFDKSAKYVRKIEPL